MPKSLAPNIDYRRRMTNPESAEPLTNTIALRIGFAQAAYPKRYTARRRVESTPAEAEHGIPTPL